MKNLKFLALFLFFVLIIWLPSKAVFASSTDGIIDPVYKYAWSENTGWINFGCDHCNVHVTDTSLTGYAWGENIGWIRLDPPNGGVLNDGEGHLSGNAWAEGAGWINFSGVTINNEGYFLGYASSTRTGRISFNCLNTNSCAQSDFKVRTDWRPQSVRGSGQQGGQQSGQQEQGGQQSSQYGGGGSPAPSDLFKIFINSGQKITNSQNVLLSFQAPKEVTTIEVSNYSDFREAQKEHFVSPKSWTLTPGDGGKIVYVNFYDSSRLLGTASSSIIFEEPKGLKKIIETIIPGLFEQKPLKSSEPTSTPSQEETAPSKGIEQPGAGPATVGEKIESKTTKLKEIIPIKIKEFGLNVGKTFGVISIGIKDFFVFLWQKIVNFLHSFF